MSLKRAVMRTTINYGLLTVILLFSLIVKAQEPPSSENYNYNTLKAQKKWIVGTFVSDDDATWKLRFTNDGKCYWYLPDKKPWNFTYTIKFSTRKASTPSGHINIYTLYLKAVPANPNKDLTYEMYTDDTGLVLRPWPMGIGGQFGFSRIKTKKPAAAAPKKEEVKPEERKKMAAEAHFLGGYDCLERNEYGHLLKDPTYEEDYSLGWEQAGCIVP